MRCCSATPVSSSSVRAFHMLVANYQHFTWWCCAVATRWLKTTLLITWFYLSLTGCLISQISSPGLHQPNLNDDCPTTYIIGTSEFCDGLLSVILGICSPRFRPCRGKHKAWLKRITLPVTSKIKWLRWREKMRWDWKFILERHVYLCEIIGRI